MASKRREIQNIELRSGGNYFEEIVDGPNDWELWLAFRRIKNETSFSTRNRIFVDGVPGFAALRLDAVIAGLEDPNPYCYSPNKVKLKGYFRTTEDNVRIEFSGIYDVQVRRGHFNLSLLVL